MSCKVLSRAAAGEARPFEWRRIHANPGPPPDVFPPGRESATGLQTRIRELESLLETCERQAYQNGLREGARQEREQSAGQIDALARTIQQLAGARAQMRREAEEDLLRLAVAIARRVLRREIQVDEEALLGVVKAALQRIEARELHRVRVNPADAQTIASAVESVCGRAVQVEPDPALERGAAIFETTRANLDASVETQLREIERGLVELVRSGR